MGDLEDRVHEANDFDSDCDEGNAELPLDIDLGDLQLADQYQAPGFLPEDEDDILPSLEFDDSIVDDATNQETTNTDPNTANESLVPSQDLSVNTSALTAMAPPQSRRPSQDLSATADASASMLPPQSRRPSQDLSEALPHPRVRDEDPDAFILALGLWCEESGISRTQYSGLREILRMLEPHPMLNRLPANFAPLRRRTKGWLPQLQLRRAMLPLNASKLPSLPEQQKKHGISGTPKENLYFFDPLNLFQTILRSQLTQKMHFGFGEFRTNPVELWECPAWTASVRTTSGAFARYRNGEPIFPSDWIVYSCTSATCDTQHLGRVVEVGRDQRDGIPVEERGRLKVKTQHAYWSHEIPKASFPFQVFSENDVMLRAEYSFLEEHSIISHKSNVIMHYDNGPLPQPTSLDEILICRSLLNSNGWLQPLAWSVPHRGELELKTYGRDYFRDYLNAEKYNCISLPYLLFLDGFGLYRNSYRSLMGVYMMLAPFNFNERTRRVNVFPITLGPHGSNLNDVLDTLISLQHADKGVILDLPEPTRVCIFPICITGDMPQQQMNAGFKSQRATLGCRFCLISSESRADLDYDTIKNGRYHYQTMQQRDTMSAIRATKKREVFASQWGLSPEEPALFRLFPALDIIVTRPSDPAHSEYAGLCKQLHQLLLEAILTAQATEQYATAMKQWPFAPGFPRLQSPVHHLKSYSLSDHARWIVVIPGLLRCWLEERHLQPHYRIAMQRRLVNDEHAFTVTEMIVRVFGFVARSTSLLMTAELKGRDQLLNTIKKARSEFQMLLSVAAVAANENPRSRSVTPSAQGRADSVIRSVETDVRGEAQGIPSSLRTAQKATEYLNDRRRPNIHTALHYEATMKEFGTPSNVNVLIGEDKHR